jgi:phage terminase large subunit
MTSAVRFQRKVLKRQLWEKQKAIARAIQTNRSVSIKGCHGSGKTFLVAGFVPYELLSDPEAVVLWIAPTLRQVKTGWNEVLEAIRRVPVKGEPPTSTGWKPDPKGKPNNYAQGFSSSRGVNAQGFHGKRVLLIVDEAIGISPDVWDAIEGIRAAGDVRIVKLCNPTVPSGPVFEDFTRLRGTPGHACITISAFDTPNLAGLTLETLLALPESELDVAPFPWLTRRRWVREMYYKWGPNNPRFRSRVLGEFPDQADDSVFALSWIERAGLPFDLEDLGPYDRAGQYIQVGIDVAGEGSDETVATARLGPFVVAMEAWPEPDPIDKLRAFLSRLKQRFRRSKLVLVGDTVGIGYYFMRAFAREGYDVRGFVANASPVDPILFKDAKAEAYFQLREHMKDGNVRGAGDEDTKAQLSDVRYRERLGRVEIESKREAKARGSHSPDRAESLVMAYVRLVARETTVVVSDGSYQISPV